jgi:hypothetical protein
VVLAAGGTRGSGRLVALEAVYWRAGRVGFFRHVQPCLEGGKAGSTDAEIARRLGTTEGTIQVTVKPRRHRFLDMLRSVILQAVGGPDDVDVELRHLLEVLRS